MYGGHVIDPADLNVVESAAVAYLSREIPLWFSGSHFLSNIISTPGNFGDFGKVMFSFCNTASVGFLCFSLLGLFWFWCFNPFVSSDLTGILHILDQHLQDPLHSSDLLVLGFSADVAAEITKVNSENLNILLQASQNPLGAVRSLCTQLKQPATLPDYGQARDRLQALKCRLTQKSHSTGAQAGAARPGPLLHFLLTEWDDLHDSVCTLLSELQRPVCCCPPTCGSLLELTNLSHLERRAELLCSYLWCHSTADPSGSYRLAAFKNAAGLLLAVIRQAAQVQGRRISDVTPHLQVRFIHICMSVCVSNIFTEVFSSLQVVNEGSKAASLLPDAVYLCGLELRGASWDAELGALQEVVCLQMCPMPLVCVDARVKSINVARATPRHEGPHKKDCSCDQVGGAPPVTEPEFPLYQCPIYLDRDLESWSSGLADVNIITTVPLHTKLHPNLCSLRRVMLVSLL